MASAAGRARVAGRATLISSKKAGIAGAVDPELLAAAKSLGLPWLEVDARHFRVAMCRRLGEAEKTLGDAARLFELAHQ